MTMQARDSLILASSSSDIGADMVGVNHEGEEEDRGDECDRAERE